MKKVKIDGFEWVILSKIDAIKRFKDNKEVYGLNFDEKTEHLIESIKDLDDFDYFGYEGNNINK